MKTSYSSYLSTTVYAHINHHSSNYGLNVDKSLLVHVNMQHHLTKTGPAHLKPEEDHKIKITNLGSYTPNWQQRTRCDEDQLPHRVLFVAVRP